MVVHKVRPNVWGRAVAGSLLLLAWLIAPACQNSKGSKYARAGDDPKDTDSLYKLLRRTLVDSNPRRTLTEYGCELDRVSERFTVDEFQRRLAALLDTVYRTPAEQRRRREVGAGLANGYFEFEKEQCGPDHRELGTSRPRDSSRAKAAKPR